jgi:hypothetical protein
MYKDDLNQDKYYSRVRSDKDAQEMAVRLGALCRVYEQTDRVLTQDPILVHVVDDGPAPAWSDGADIFINKDQIENFDLEELVQVNGLNYHELAHHLYSPRKGTSLMQWVIEQENMSYGYLSATNILEDQRIETLLVARYPAIVPFLTATVVRWLGREVGEAMGNYAAIRGRQYLPLDLRIAFRDIFVRPDLIPVIAEIVDEYRLLHFPKGYDRAQDLIQRFKEEVLDQLGLPEPPGGGPSGCGGRNPVSKGRPEPSKAQQRDSERAAGMGGKEPEFIYKPPMGGESDNDGQDNGDSESDVNNGGTTSSPSNNGDVIGQDAGSSGTNFVPPKTAEEAINARETDKPASHVPGQGHAESLGGIPDNVQDILASIEDSILNRKDVQQEIRTKQRVIVGGDGKHEDSIKRGKYSELPVPGGVLIAARRFARELERLKQECEPTWQREMPGGRINVQRVIRGCEVQNAFDRWEEGTDGTDIETVMLIDRSGSMGSNHNDVRASEAAWVIKRALEQIDSPVTIYGFDDKTELVSDRKDKVNRINFPFIFGNGGTDPRGSLIAAERLLKSSRAKGKILFLVTDGMFNHGDNDAIISRLNDAGVMTVLIMIADDQELEWYSNHYKNSGNDPWHNCSIHGVVKSANDLIPFAKQVVTGMIRKSIRA